MPRLEPEPYSDFRPAYPELKSLAIGTEIQDEDGEWWIFVGWRRNTARHEAWFCEIFFAQVYYGGVSQLTPRTYHASGYDTLCRKFPRLAEIENDQRPNLY